MGIQFNLDGTTSFIPEPSEQEFLHRRVLSFEENKLKNFEDLRNYRSSLLLQSDWTILPDSPISDLQKTDWQSYRQSLRNLPNHSNAPDRFLISDWALAPGQTEIPENAKLFIAEISDPLGIGTTSWVGIGTDDQLIELQQPQPEVVEEPTTEPEPEVVEEPTPEPEP
jgi:hypothetical protein